MDIFEYLEKCKKLHDPQKLNSRCERLSQTNANLLHKIIKLMLHLKFILLSFGFHNEIFRDRTSLRRVVSLNFSSSKCSVTRA